MVQCHSSMSEMISRGTEVGGLRQGYRPRLVCILSRAWARGFDLQVGATVQEVGKYSEMLGLIPEPCAIPAPSRRASTCVYGHPKMLVLPCRDRKEGVNMDDPLGDSMEGQNVHFEQPRRQPLSAPPYSSVHAPPFSSRDRSLP